MDPYRQGPAYYYYTVEVSAKLSDGCFSRCSLVTVERAISEEHAGQLALDDVTRRGFKKVMLTSVSKYQKADS